jgi:hypothetical protein
MLRRQQLTRKVTSTVRTSVCSTRIMRPGFCADWKPSSCSQTKQPRDMAHDSGGYNFARECHISRS